tara:strand:- start:206 stop:850 length:645 start_codon:yes stop_codon:yes gene_type:complete
MMEKKRFLDFLDMFDGGGAGQMGDKFEGGGLLSAIGNAFGSPYGSEDPERMAARQAFYNSQNIGGAPMTSAPPPQVMPNNTAGATEPNYADRFGVPMPAAYSPVPPTDEQRFGMNPPAVVAQYSGQGNFGSNMNPANAYGPAAVTSGPQYSGQGNFGSNMNPTNAYNEGDPMERFSRQMIDMLGLDEAQRLMSTDMGAQAYKVFVDNNYNMPNY